jgi:ABC-2 type transport system permease protein
MTRHNVEDVMPLLTIPLFTFVSMAIMMQARRPDLASFALTAGFLMTLGQMGFFVASEIIVGERHSQTLELTVASPAPYFAVVMTRILIITLLGLAGLAISWVIVRYAFGVRLELSHPLVFAATLLATTFAQAGTAVLTASLFSMASEVRTLQHAMNGPLYLLGGVLVPASYLPHWLQPLSPCIYFSWAADLMRDSFKQPPPSAVLVRLGMILALGLAAAVIAALVLRRILDRLRADGRLGLA